MVCVATAAIVASLIAGLLLAGLDADGAGCIAVLTIACPGAGLPDTASLVSTIGSAPAPDGLRPSPVSSRAPPRHA